MKLPMRFDTDNGILTRRRTWLAGYLLSPSLVLAQSSLPGGEADYFKLTLTLLFIVGLILACSWLVRRMTGGSGFNNRHFKVLSVMPLGTREKLMLVKAADEYLLLGVTPNSITTLHRYDEPIDMSEAALSSPFADRMKGLLKGLDSDSQARHKQQNTHPDSDKDG